ncbi:MAG: NUDIX domain-containing protein [Nitrososphaerota archaeon]|nr:NUDIX domain-containing protein [Nitrososphaerota archaeon]
MPSSELIYTVDESGNLLNLEPREELHLTKTSKRHAAVIGMLIRKDEKFLVQWRSSSKLGGDRLDVSATTHVKKGETYESATLRSFEKELSISSKIQLVHGFDFRYEEDLGDHKENEYCKVYIAKYDGKFEPNPEEIDSVEFMSLEELQEFIRSKSEKATKWLRETVTRMSRSMLRSKNLV